jgi:MYXO-CTERM domain-containing protein
MWSLVAFSLVAPPPLGDFPAVVLPADVQEAPSNTVIFAFGDPAPSPDQIGVTVTVDGAPGPTLTIEKLGCCVILATPPEPFAQGSTIAATVSSAAGDVSTTFTVGLGDDERPTFATAPSALDHGPSEDGAAYEIVIGADATDNVAAALLLAEKDGAVVGVSADGFILKARIPGTPEPGELCVDVSAMDLAMNLAIPALGVCVTVDGDPSEGEGEGEGDGEGEGEGEQPGGCACASTSPAAGLGALLLFIRRRRRRAAPLSADH